VNKSHRVRIAGISQLRFCSQWTFKNAPLLHVSLYVSWALSQTRGSFDIKSKTLGNVAYLLLMFIGAWWIACQATVYAFTAF